MTEQCIRNDPGEMKIASRASWLCRLFQSHSFTPEEKQNIIRETTEKFKLEELENGQGD